MSRYSVNMRDINLKTELQNVTEINGNAGELQQIFINLISNAIDAMEGQGELLIRMKEKDDFIHIEVTDRGKGIEKKNIKKIFDPFFTTKEVGKGTGLGLHVINQIVKKNHGDILLKSEVGKGTTFTIKLPVYQNNGGG